MPPPATSSFSSPSPSDASSISSSSSSFSSSSSSFSSSSSSGSISSSSSLLSASLLASTSPLTPRPRLCWRAPPPSPRRRPLPHQWMHPTTTTPISPTTSTSTLTPTSPPSSAAASSASSSSSIDRATSTSTSSSFSLAPSSHDPLTSLRLSAFMNDSLTSSTFERPPRIPQTNPFQRFSLSAPCSPALSSRPSQLVFASGAVGTASGLGHVFGRPLQAKETIPCSALNCTQWQKEPSQSLAQQAQSPSHTFQQQCAVHKRFRLFRQRPRRCQIHASSYHHHSGATSQGKEINNGPNYILPPTTVYPLVVRPDKILLDHHEEPPVQESWWPTLTSSISMSSRLSISTVSLSLSTTNTTTSSTVSFQAHGSEDDESFLSTGGSYPSSKASKMLSKKEKKLQKQLQKQEQQRQQQQQQKLRCLCYLDTSLDNQIDIQQSQQSQKQQYPSQQSKGSSKNSKDKEKEKDREATGRLRRIWNDSVINFHKSKSPGSNGSRQSPSPSPSPSHSSSGYDHTTVTGAGDSSQHSNNSQADAGVSMRHSLSGTDISDEGNHSLSDIEDDLLDGESFQHLRHGTTGTSSTSSNSSSNYSHHRVSFQGPYGASFTKASSASGATSRPKDDLKAIARHQAELSLQQHQEPSEDNNKDGEDDFRYSMSMDDDEDPDRVLASLPPPPPPVLSSFDSHITENNEEDDEDEDWDIQSDSGAPSSSTLMYSADVREPSCRSTLALPMSANPAHNKAYLKKPSNANLSSLRSRQRCISLPADTVPPKGGFLKMSSSTPSENWDEDFDISADIHVPTKVVENQMSLQMDLYNIKDFASQIEDLKTLRASLRTASSSLKATNPKKHQDLSMLFQRDWEQAEVIIDLGEIAQTSPTTTSPPGASSSLGTSGKKASEPSLASLSTGAAGGLSSKPSMGFKPRRPALSTSAPANSHLNGLSAFQSIQRTHQARSESQSSSLTGATLIDIEAAVEGLALSQQASTSPMAYMKESCSSPARLGLCTSPMTPLRTSTNRNSTSSTNDEDYDEYDNDDLEIKYENASIGLLRFPEGERPLHRGFHNKEDSSATVKPLSPRSPKEEGGSGFQAEMEASFRRYQKYSHYSKRRTTGGLPNNRRPTDECYEVLYDDEEDDEEEEDDGYESYGSSSIGVFTPIPSDRHMQVLKDILMEGLGTEVARQYMFKQGEQDHVRFSVEVIPGLLGHLKGLQQRLGDQLMELQSLTVIV
ncbi:hypothetical protein BGZ47_001906 [Haplosporangium gracile]|nr:hypothetical protein BGZ47_001906 [Haplosporangium gracile]